MSPQTLESWEGFGLASDKLPGGCGRHLGAKASAPQRNTHFVSGGQGYEARGCWSKLALAASGQ